MDLSLCQSLLFHMSCHWPFSRLSVHCQKQEVVSEKEGTCASGARRSRTKLICAVSAATCGIRSRCGALLSCVRHFFHGRVLSDHLPSALSQNKPRVRRHKIFSALLSTSPYWIPVYFRKYQLLRRSPLPWM